MSRRYDCTVEGKTFGPAAETKTAAIDMVGKLREKPILMVHVVVNHAVRSLLEAESTRSGCSSSGDGGVEKWLIEKTPSSAREVTRLNNLFIRVEEDGENLLKNLLHGR